MVPAYYPVLYSVFLSKHEHSLYDKKNVDKNYEVRTLVIYGEEYDTSVIVRKLRELGTFFF